MIVKLQFLGTAAYEGVPAMFCDCDVCRRSLKLGGKNIRTRSQAIIDDKLLIDFPADIYAHMIQHNVDLGEVSSCIVTHDHSDHLYPQDIPIRSEGFVPVLKQKKPLVFFAPRPAYNLIAEQIKKYSLDKMERVEAKTVEPFCSFETDGYTITPLKASHDPKCEPVFYIIEKDGKSILYANDTDVFFDQTWQYLRQSGKRFDLISLDCTKGDMDSYFAHMSLKECAQTKEKLYKLGLIDNDTVCVINHFSHNNGRTYDDMCKAAKEYGFITSYDGLTIEV